MTTTKNRVVRSHGLIYNQRLIGRIYPRPSGKFVVVTYFFTTIPTSKTSIHVSLDLALKRIADNHDTFPGFCTLIKNYRHAET